MAEVDVYVIYREW